MKAADRRAARGLVLLGALALLGACGKPEQPWHLTNITGIMPPLQFKLDDASTGKRAAARDFVGHVVLLYFGYAHCPDVCPTTLSHMSRAIRALGTRADRVRLLFVSVDPARDHGAALASYARAFGPQTVGLTGTQDELKALTRRYRATYGYGKPDADGNYEVSHSSAVYVFDGSGKVRLLIKPSDAADDVTADLARLLDEG